MPDGTLHEQGRPLDAGVGASGPPSPDAPRYDAWTLGRARLVAYKAERLLTEAKRELGAFGEPTLGSPAGPRLLEASEHVTDALRVLDELQRALRDAGTR